MRHACEIVLLACVAYAHADSTHELVDRAFKMSSIHGGDLDDTTFGKSAHLVAPSRATLSTRSAVRPQALGQSLTGPRFQPRFANSPPNSQTRGMQHPFQHPMFGKLFPTYWEQQAASHRGVHIQAAAAAAGSYDYDLVIIGCGVGGHGAAIHAVKQGFKTAIIEGAEIGGTCVNRGCVPSKALLAASGRIREMQDKKHMDALGLTLENVGYDRAKVAAHATGLANTVQKNLENSLVALGVDILRGFGTVTEPHTVKYGNKGTHRVNMKTVTANNIIISTGSVPFVPKGIEVDGKTVFTSDEALKLDWVPEWVAIIGSGYIGLEFSDVYTALGSEVSFVEALDVIMPGFDREVARLAERVLIKPRKIEYYTGVFATKVTPGIAGEKPTTIELTDAKTKKVIDTLEPDAVLVATGRAPFTDGLGLDNVNVELNRGFVPCDEKMRVQDKDGNIVEGLWCIGDANGKMMLAHAASAQGISAVENMCERENILDHQSIPAACFTHPEVAFVGLTEEQAKEKAKEEGFDVAISKTSFKANSKALAELESDGLAKCIYRKDTKQILGFWIMGIHAADMIHEASNAMSQCLGVDDLQFYVHAHPTVAEVVDEVFKGAQETKVKVMDAHR